MVFNFNMPISTIIVSRAKCISYSRLATFVVVYISSFFLNGTSAPVVNSQVGSVDVSWQLVLEYAARLNLQFGQDIIFTFGPLGFLYSDISLGYLLWQRIVFALFWAGLVSWFATEVTFRLEGISRYLFLGWFLFFFSPSGELERNAYFVMLFGCSVLSGNFYGRKFYALLLVVVFAALAMIKFTFFLTAIVSIVICVAMQVYKNNIKEALFLSMSYCAAFAALWLLAGQRLVNVIPWIKGGLELSAGYTEAMTLQPKIFVLVFCVMSLIAFSVVIVKKAMSSLMNVNSSGWLLLLVIYTFLAWKQGFVRADGHVFNYVYLLPLLLGLFLASPNESIFKCRAENSDKFFFLTIIMLCLAAVFAQKEYPVHQHLVSWPQNIQRNISHVLDIVSGDGRKCYSAFNLENRPIPEMDLPVARSIIGTSTVDVINYQQAIAIVNGLNYQPRPVIQGYSAYTPYLQNINYAFYRSSRRPEFLLFRMETIDERLETLDDATILPLIFYDYVPIANDGKFLIMRKTGPVPKEHELNLIHEQEVNFNESISLAPFNDRVLVMQVDTQKTITEKVVGLIYQADPVYIKLVSGNQQAVKRFIPNMAKHGVIINPNIVSNNDIVNIYKKTGLAIDTITFSKTLKPASKNSGSLHIRLYELLP